MHVTDSMEPMDDETFARLFTAQYAAFADDLPLWLGLADEFGGPILEIGCGAGRVVRAWPEPASTVTGIDTNPAMLLRAQTAIAGEEGNRIHLVERDVRRLGLEQRFRLILAPCNTLSALADDGTRTGARPGAGRTCARTGSSPSRSPGRGSKRSTMMVMSR